MNAGCPRRFCVGRAKASAGSSWIIYHDRPPAHRRRRASHGFVTLTRPTLHTVDGNGLHLVGYCGLVCRVASRDRNTTGQAPRAGKVQNSNYSSALPFFFPLRVFGCGSLYRFTFYLRVRGYFWFSFGFCFWLQVETNKEVSPTPS